VLHSTVPSAEPSQSPSLVPSSVPSNAPTVLHSEVPSREPSLLPSSVPSSMPSDSPTVVHSALPTFLCQASYPPDPPPDGSCYVTVVGIMAPDQVYIDIFGSFPDASNCAVLEVVNGEAIEWRAVYYGGRYDSPWSLIDPWDCSTMSELDVSEIFCPVEIIAPPDGRVQLRGVATQQNLVDGDLIYMVNSIDDYEWRAETLGTDSDYVSLDMTGCPISTLDTPSVPDIWCDRGVLVPSMYDGEVYVNITNPSEPSGIVLETSQNLTMIYKHNTDLWFYVSANGYTSPTFLRNVKYCAQELKVPSYLCDMTISTTGGHSIEVDGAPGVEWLSGDHIYLPKDTTVNWRKYNTSDNFATSLIACDDKKNAEGVSTSLWALATVRHLQSSIIQQTSTSLLTSILKANFTGASGPVQFGKEFVKGRNFDGITVGVYNVRPHLLGSDTAMRSHQAFLISIWQDGEGWVDIPGTELVYRDGSTKFVGVYRKIYDGHYITPVVRAIGLGLMGVAWLVAILSMVLLSRLKKNQIILKSQPFFMHMLCIGSLITSATIFTVSFDEDAGWTNRQLSIVCALAPWFFFTGHTLLFCSFFIVLWRVSRVFQFQQTAISLYKALWPLALFLTVTFSTLLAHSIYDSWSWKRDIISEIPAETYGMCQSSHSRAFFFPLVGLLVVAEALTLYFAWKTSHVKTDFQDSTSIMYACFMQVQSWMVGIPMVSFIGYSSVDATYFARVFLIWVFALSGVLFVVCPKIIKAMQLQRNPNPSARKGTGRRFAVTGLSIQPNSSMGIPSAEFRDFGSSGELLISSAPSSKGHQSGISMSALKQIRDDDSED